MGTLERVRFDSIAIRDTCILFLQEGIPIVVRKGTHNSAQSLVGHLWTDGIDPGQEVARVRA